MSHNQNVDATYEFTQSLASFAEFKNLAPNFERVKVNRLVVRVLPHQNVSNNSTSRVANYCVFPYHKNFESPNPTFEAALSVDKAKVYRVTQKAVRSFVPCTYCADVPSNPAGSTSYEGIRWKPEFIIDRTTNTMVTYNGAMAFEKIDGATEENKTHFTIIFDIYCVFKNQRSFV